MYYLYSINIQHIDCYSVKGLWCCFSYTIIDYHLFYDWAVDIQIWAPLTRSQCKVSDTQVTVKACGSLVSLVIYKKCMIEKPSFLTINGELSKRISFVVVVVLIVNRNANYVFEYAYCCICISLICILLCKQFINMHIVCRQFFAIHKPV